MGIPHGLTPADIRHLMRKCRTAKAWASEADTVTVMLAWALYIPGRQQAGSRQAAQESWAMFWRTPAWEEGPVYPTGLNPCSSAKVAVRSLNTYPTPSGLGLEESYGMKTSGQGRWEWP